VYWFVAPPPIPEQSDEAVLIHLGERSCLNLFQDIDRFTHLPQVQPARATDAEMFLEARSIRRGQCSLGYCVVTSTISWQGISGSGIIIASIKVPLPSGPDSGPGSMEQDALIGLSYAENGRDLRGAQPLHIAQRDDLPLAWLKGLNSLLDDTSGLI
jgi:hypothetical protein